MVKQTRKVLAFLLAVAMVINPFMSMGELTVKADTNDLVLGWPDWNYNEDLDMNLPAFSTNEQVLEESYGNNTGKDIKTVDTIFIGTRKDAEAGVSKDAKISLSYRRSAKGVWSAAPEGCWIEPWNYGIEEQGENGEFEWVNVYPDEGFFDIYLTELGYYKITVNGKSATIDATAPYIGLYENADGTGLVASQGNVYYETGNSNTYYVIFDGMDAKDRGDKARVTDIQVRNPKFEDPESEFAYVSVCDPGFSSSNYELPFVIEKVDGDESILAGKRFLIRFLGEKDFETEFRFVRTPYDDGDTAPWWQASYSFSPEISGFVVANADWEEIDETHGKNTFINDTGSYSKRFYMDVNQACPVSLAMFGENGKLSPVEQDDLDSISVNGPENGLKVGIKKGEDEFEEGTFCLNANAPGNYTVIWKNGSEDRSAFLVEVGMPAIGVYNTDSSFDFSNLDEGWCNNHEYSYGGEKTYYFYLKNNIDESKALTVNNIQISWNAIGDDTDWCEISEEKPIRAKYFNADVVGGKNNRLIKFTITHPDQDISVGVKFAGNVKGREDLTFNYETWERFRYRREGLVVAGTEMSDRQPVFDSKTGGYGKTWEIQTFDDQTVSLGVYSEDKVEPITVAPSEFKWAVLCPDDTWQAMDENEVAVDPADGNEKTVNVYSYNNDIEKTPLSKGVYRVRFMEEGSYNLAYNESSVTFNSNKPLAGIYTTSSPKTGKLLCISGGEYDYNSDTNYLVANDLDSFWRIMDFKSKVTVTASEGVKFAGKNAAGGFVWENGYEPLAFSVDGMNDEWIRLTFDADPRPREEGEEKDYGEQWMFWLRHEKKGLVVTWQDRGESIEDAGVQARMGKRHGCDFGDDVWMFIGMSDGNGNVTPLTESQLKSLKLTVDGKTTDTELRLSNYWSILDPVEPGVIWFEAAVAGEYRISLDGSDDYALVDVDYPMAAFTNTAAEIYDISDPKMESKLVNRVKQVTVTGGEQNKVYLSVRTDSDPDKFEDKVDIEIESLTFKSELNQQQVDENISYEISADKKSAVITLKDKLYVPNVEVIADLNTKWSSYMNGVWYQYDEHPEPRGGIWINLESELLTDGDGGKTFSAIFMPEQWFEAGEPWVGEADYPFYWVHSDSMQEVIDKLTEAAAKDYADVYSADRKKWIKHNVKNTGYIYIVTNAPRAGKEMPKHYISSSGEIKGIMITAGGVENASMSDTAESSGLDFMDAPILDPKDFIAKLNAYDGVVPNKESILATLAQIQSAGNGVVFEAGNAYEAKKSTHTYTGATTGKQHSDDYYYFDKTVKFTLNEQIFDYLNVNGIYQPTYLEGVNITASSTCGYVFRGDMGELRIGYPEGFDPKNANIRITDLGDYDPAIPEGWLPTNVYDINLSNGAESHPAGYTISSTGKHVEKTGGQQAYSYSYKLYTYQIKMETEVTGNIPDATVNKEDIDPNSFKNFSQGEKKSIEEGGKLTVSVKADEVNEAEATAQIEADDPLYEQKKDLQDSIAEIRVATAGYEIQGGIGYYDLGINTTVAVSDNSAGAGVKPDIVTTNSISETSKPVEIVVPVTLNEGANIRKIRFMRSHKTKTGAFENEFFKMVYTATEFENNRRDGICWAEVVSRGGNIVINMHIMSSRYSTFALFEYTGEPKEVDLSGVKWDYTGPIVYDGKEHEVKLKDVPTGVMVVYSGNDKIEAGKYTACTEFSVTDDVLYKLPNTIPAGLQSLDWEIRVKSDNNNGGSGNGNGTSGSSGGSGGGGGGGGAEEKPAVSGNTVSTNTVSSNTTTTSGNTVKEGDIVKVDGVKATFKVTGLAADGKSGTVTYVSADDKNAKKITVPSKVTIDGKEYTVTAIGAKAFRGCKKLETVKIPATVTTIGKAAFAGCKKLKKVVIPKNVTKIDAKAFKGDAGIKVITIKSKKIKSFGKKAFKGVPKTAKIKVPKAKKSAYAKKIKKAGFKGTVK